MQRPRVGRLAATLGFATISALGGCAVSDATAQGDAPTTGGDGGSDPSGSDVTGGDESTGYDTTPGSTSPDSTGDGATGAETGDGPIQVACELADCAPGECVVLDDGRASCECPADTVLAGLQCLTCESVTEGYDVTIGGTDVSLTVTYDGSPFPEGGGETSTIWLRDPGNGELISLGNPAAGLRTVRVVPRVYEVVYGAQGGSVIPANRRATIGIVNAKTGPSVEVAIDIPTVQLTGRFSFDGQDAAGLTEYGNVWLRAPSGDEVFLGRTDGGSFVVPVIPGAYEVHFESVNGGGVAPINARGLVTVETIPVDEESHDLAIDIATAVVAGDFLFDGDAPPSSPSERAEFFFRSPGTGEEFSVGVSDGGSYQVRVIPGTYDVVLSGDGGAVAPANSHAIVRSLDTADSKGHTIDVLTARISGAITIDDLPPPSDPSDDGRLVLRGTSPGDEVQLGTTVGAAYDVVVVAGSYDVHYAQDSSSGVAPLNTNARIREIDALNDAIEDIDVPTALVSGVITIADGAPPDSDYDDGWVYLRNAQTGDSVLLASTRMGQFSGRVVPGTYEVTYVVENAGGEVPINAHPIPLFDVEVTGDLAFDVDVPVRELGGAIASDADAGERGALFLRPAVGSERSLLGTTASASYQQRVVPGRYVVAYGLESGGSALPRNTDAALACIELAAR